MVLQFRQPVLGQQSPTPEEPQPSTAETLLGSLLSGGLQGASKDFTQRRSQRKIGEITDDPDLSLEQKMNALLSTPGIAPGAAQESIKNLQFQEDQRLKSQESQLKNQLMSRIFGGASQSPTNQPSAVGGGGQAFGERPPVDAVSSVPGDSQKGRQFTDEQILAASAIDPQFGAALEKRQAASEKALQAQASRAAPVVNEFFNELNKRSAENIKKRGLLELQEEAIREGDLEFFSKASFSETLESFGFDQLAEAFRDPNAAKFKFASKEFLLSNISRAGPRPNQWIEQQISKSLPAVGRSRDANLVLNAAQRADVDVAEEEERLASEVEQEQINKFGFAKRTLPSEVNKRLRSFASERQKQLEQEMREITGSFKTGKVPAGTRLGVNKSKWYAKRFKGDLDKAFEQAIKDGHVVVPQEEI